MSNVTLHEKIKEYIKTTDYVYLIICAGLSTLSVITLFSVAEYGQLQYGGVFGSFRPAYMQIFASVCGLLLSVVVSLIDVKRLAKFWPYIAAVCWGLVLLTFIPGVGYAPPGTGSQSWIVMPFGASFQPTEIAKISFYMTFAVHLSNARQTINKPKTLLFVILHLIVPVIIIHLQGDDGTALVFLATGLIMLYAAGLNRWVVIAFVTAALASLPLIWTKLLTSHQQQRILGLFFPDEYTDTIMYQQLQGRQAISEGGIFGKGLFQPNHVYVPRSENDFIFSYFAESFGFVGSLLLIGLLLAVIIKTLHVAFKAQSYVEAYICIGVFSAMIVQTTINLGMNLMLVPVSGLTLPFVSAGGTSVLMLYLSMGLVIAVSRSIKLKNVTRSPLSK